MRIRIYILFFALMLIMLLHTANAESEQDSEYNVKAAFVYNFIKFIDWPENKLSDENTIGIGIIGENPFGEAFDPIENKQIRNKKIVIKLFKSLEESKLTSKQVDNIRKCYVLFVCKSEKKQFKKIIDLIKEYNVLTVGDTSGFLESGGIIDFLIENQKVCFEVNNYNAKQAKLNIRSQLLRLAKNVVEEEDKGGN